MRVVVTGACGFVGGHLIEHLLKCGDTVLGTVAPGSKIEVNGAEYCELDITAADACCNIIGQFKPDVIYHLAGISFVPQADENFSEALLVNVGGVRNVIKAALSSSRDCRFVLISSSDVYGKVAPQQLPISESHSVSPCSSYALSKVMAEAALGMLSRVEGLQGVIMRPFIHIGPGQNERFVVSNFAKQLAAISKAQAAPQIRVGNLEARRDFTDVRDIVRAYRLAAEKGQGIYNLGSGASVSIRAILEQLIEISGLKVEVVQDPERMRPSDIPELVCDIRRARSELGWEPQIKLRESLEAVYRYWLG